MNINKDRFLSNTIALGAYIDKSGKQDGPFFELWVMCHKILDDIEACGECIIEDDSPEVSRLVCAECGSDNVDVQAWVNINTNEFGGDVEDSTRYCNECGKDVEVIKEDEIPQPEFNPEKEQEERDEYLIDREEAKRQES